MAEKQRQITLEISQSGHNIQDSAKRIALHWTQETQGSAAGLREYRRRRNQNRDLIIVDNEDEADFLIVVEGKR